MNGIIDPPTPPEPGDGDQLKASDLKNAVLVIRPTGHDTVEGKDGKPWEFVEADVWVLDRAGIVSTGTGVRFSWWRARSQLKDKVGQFVACKPVETEDRSVILVPLTGDAREVAAKVVAELEGGTPEVEPGTETF